MSQPLSEGKRLGRYKLTRRLATGGMAEVWLARATGIQGFAKDIVIKTILPHHADDPEFVRMFVNEALLASGLNHPNVVQIFDLGRLGRAYFIAMEYIAGRSLRQVKRAHQEAKIRVPQWLILRMALSACDALDYAHSQCDDDGEPLGIVHRDVTPENIMISFAGVTKVLDFGIAKAAAAGAGSTQAGRIKGKFAYLAPEQILGAGRPGGVDGRVDVYALGVVMYELLTGRRPLRASNEVELLKLVLHDEPVPAADVVKGIRRDLSDLVMKAMCKDPTKRYRSALDLRADLEQYMRATGTLRSERDVAAHMKSLFPSGARPETTKRKPRSGAYPKEAGAEAKLGSRERLAKPKKRGAGSVAAAKPEPQVAPEGAPEVDVTIDLSEVSVLGDDDVELVEAPGGEAETEEAELPIQELQPQQAAEPELLPDSRPTVKPGPRKRPGAGKRARSTADSDGPKPGSKPKAAKKSQRKLTPPPLPASEQNKAKQGKAKKGKAKQGQADSEDLRDEQRPSSQAGPGSDEHLPSVPGIPESAPVGAVHTDVQVSTGASGRGLTKPSAGVPPLAESDGVGVGIVELVHAAKPQQQEEGTASPGPVGSGDMDLGLPSPSSADGLPALSTDGLPMPTTAGDLPSPSAGDDLPEPVSPGLAGPSTGGDLPAPVSEELPTPSTDGLPTPSTDPGLPTPSTDMALPTPSTDAGLPTPTTDADLPSLSTDPGLQSPAAEPDLPTPSSERTAAAPSAASTPSSNPQLTGDQRTPWDILISRSRTSDEDEDGAASTAAAVAAVAADDATAAVEGPDEQSSSHAWDVFLQRSQVATRPAELSDAPAEESVQVLEEPSPSQWSVADEDTATGHMWDAVLTRGRTRAQSDEPPPGRYRVRELVRQREQVRERERQESSADGFPKPGRQSVSAEAQAAAAFDEGLELMRKGDRDGACRAWERAVELHPDERRYRSNLSMLRKKIEGKPR